MSTVRPDPVG